MNYIILALLSLVGFGFHDFFVRLISPRVPAAWIAGIAALVGGLLIMGFAWLGRFSFTGGKSLLLPVLLGLLLGFAYVTYVMALAKGPLSVVPPIVGLYFILPALLGVIFLGESITLSKVSGIGLAGLAIYLLTR